MLKGLIAVLIFASLISLLVFKYESPSKTREKISGRGGDFEH